MPSIRRGGAKWQAQLAPGVVDCCLVGGDAAGQAAVDG